MRPDHRRAGLGIDGQAQPRNRKTAALPAALSFLPPDLNIPRMRQPENRRRFNRRLPASAVNHPCEWNLFEAGLL